MTNTIGAIAGVVLICAASALAGSTQSSSAQTRLNPRIRPADAQRYKSIQDGKDWENPYLVTGPDGIHVRAKGLPAGGKTVAAADLERTLTRLPVTAWPYGRLVAVQEPSIRRGERSDDEPIADNLAAAIATLKSLDVTVHRWPSDLYPLHTFTPGC
jgi:hypothetical protein